MNEQQQSKILIVDDEPSNVQLLEGMLKKDGYASFKSLTDPRQVVGTFIEWHPDLILLDIMMPHMDGFAVISALKEHIAPDDYLPIIILTADLSAQTKNKALSCGAADFITKPFDITEVLLRIRNQLHARALHQQLQRQNDILEEKVRERTKELHEANERFRRLTSELHDVVWSASPDGMKIYDLNDAFEDIYGISAQQFIANPKLWIEMVHPEDRSLAERSAEELLKRGRAEVEYRIVRQDGTIRWIRDRKSLIKDEQGNPVEMGGIATDITERKNLEKQILRNQRMESLGTLAGGIAHDLNNVLAPITLSLSILRKKLPDEQSQKMLQMLEATAKRGADLIKQVLSFARGAEGERTSVQLRHLIEEIAKIIKATFPKSITLHTNVPNDLPTISADATQLHQVLMNLCVNARDAMPNGGRLAITAESVLLDEHYSQMHIDAKPGLYVLISVTDQGIGMSPEVVDKIFEPFFTTKDLGKGTGLGLSTVHSIVKSHGGFINVYSEVGKGTTFKVYLPVSGDVQRVVLEEKKEIPHVGNNELILVVDDEATIREMTKATLETSGFRVLTAGDGTEAVAQYALHQKAIDLLVVDMMMPFMDGNATIRAIQRINPKAKFIVVSGLQQNELTVKQESVTFLHKPYTADKLLTAIKTTLGK